MSIKYLSVSDILDIHDAQILEFGGGLGLRDEFLLMSAIARPQSGYYSTIIEQACALWESLSQNHPFIDGNKRTALDATLTFLAINGYTLNTEDADLTKFLLNLYANNNFCFKELHTFLLNNVIISVK
ncbi:MAG: type II toxin-antitoxin system death-on-curing family toxin [Alphaproteobacteria bacterium]|jgi:death-on-curing protein|nr:type II toxin-antitoxin system death-on-curing family toxin [Alphaproteobacteria bacterium]